MRYLVGCLLAAVLVVFVGVVGFAWLRHTLIERREAYRQWRPTNIATGYQFPPAAEITRVEVWLRQGQSIDPTTFDAPAESWGELLSSLSPSERDPVPGKWVDFGSLHIKTRQEQEIVINLYDLDDMATGAFSIKSDGQGKTRSYYRGGNTAQLKAALSKALAAYQQRTAHGGSAASPQSSGAGQDVDDNKRRESVN